MSAAHAPTACSLPLAQRIEVAVLTLGILRDRALSKSKRDFVPDRARNRTEQAVLDAVRAIPPAQRETALEKLREAAKT